MLQLGGVAAGAGASVTGDGVSIGYLTTAGGGSSVAIGRGLTTTANQVRIGESGVTDAYLGQGNATLHIGAINSSGKHKWFININRFVWKIRS